MVRLEAFIDDKKVAKVLYALDGLVIQLTMLPVKNAMAKPTGIVGAGGPTTGPEALNQLIDTCIKAKQTTFKTEDAVSFAATYGIQASTIKAAIMTFKKQKLLKTKSRGVFLIKKQGA